MLIGYARVSTDDQNLSLQRDALGKNGVKPAVTKSLGISSVEPSLNDQD